MLGELYLDKAVKNNDAEVNDILFTVTYIYGRIIKKSKGRINTRIGLGLPLGMTHGRKLTWALSGFRAPVNSIS